VKKFSLLRIALVLLAVIFIANQLITTLYKPISVETTQFYNANDGFKITGVVIRNETYVTTPKDGVLHYMLNDGERVSNGGVIANIYQSEDASITLSQIDTIKNKISDIKEIISLNNIEAANLEVAKENVSKNLDSLILSSSFGNFEEIHTKSEKLLSAINRRQAILGDTSNFSEQLSVLNSEYDAVKNSLPNAVGKIKSKKSGYFLTKTDGYENIFDINDLSSLTPEFLKSISPKEVPENVVGKIVSDYEWYIAANVSLSQSLNFKEGDALKIYTEINSSPVLDVKIKKINISNNNTDAVIVFSCNNMNSDLAALRSASMLVVDNEYSGLRISKKSLRMPDSVSGVYVVEGMQIKFKKVKIVYTADDFVLCEKSDDDDALRLYDQVVVKGKNLYDGKIIS
jgi:hypothetical protein